jgi:hypothetical protein
MLLGRKLAEGVGGWLQFEFHCHRSEVFSEKYLAAPVGQILSAVYKTHVYAEVNHPYLRQFAMGSGRRPQIDFVVCDPYPDIKIAVESKWVGKTGIKLEHLIWDLLRLELLAHHFNAESFFLLAGRKKYLDRLFQAKAFRGPVKSGKIRPVLKLPGTHTLQMRLDQPPMARVPVLKNVLQMGKVLNSEIPSKVVSSIPVVFPAICTSYAYQVYVWQIQSASERTTFIPADHAHYK